MKSNDEITLMMVCDNHLIVMLAVLLKSIEKNHCSSEVITVYIINDRINRRNIQKIEETVSATAIRIVWKTMRDVLPRGMKLPLHKTSLPKSIYARLFIHRVVPASVSKIIYLDSDMLLLKDISELWKIPMGDYVIGAVQDKMQVVSSRWGAIKNYQALGLAPDTKYFNAGLLLINLEKWRHMNAAEAIIDIINKNIDDVTFTDQYGLNVLFANSWLELESHWNSYSMDEMEDPSLIHFIGVKPIYKTYHYNYSYYQKFYDIVQETPWRDFSPKSEFNRKVKIVSNLLNNGSRAAILYKLKKLMINTD